MSRNNKSKPIKPPGPKYGWRISEWHPAVGISRAQFYKLLNAGAPIETVKIGSATIIRTPPDVFLARLAGEAAA